MFEDLRFGEPIDAAIERDGRVSAAMPRVAKRPQLLQRLCRSGGRAFAGDGGGVKRLALLFERGLLYTDERMETRVANKAVFRAICSNK